MTKYSTPTTYNGIRFRSRLEADFARWFDENGMLWSYEAEGYRLANGLSYLPDFFLPAQRAWFECKGVMLDEDEAKILQLAHESNLDVFVGSHIYRDEVLLQVVDMYNDNPVMYQGEILLAKCNRCEKVWLMTEYGGWACRICGNYDGNAHFEILRSFSGWRGEGAC